MAIFPYQISMSVKMDKMVGVLIPATTLKEASSAAVRMAMLCQKMEGAVKVRIYIIYVHIIMS